MAEVVKVRSLPQNRKFSALVAEVARQYPLIPYRRAFAHEAWKRHLLALYVRESRLVAWQAGAPDPFPVRPVPSSDLTSEQYSELIECSSAWCAEHGVECK